MGDRAESMVHFHGGPTPTPWIEIDRSEVSPERVRRFLRGAAGASDTRPLPPFAPLSFALVLRRGHGPELTLAPEAFGIHGGHDIVMEEPIAIGRTYGVSARVERIYRKTGRSGPMTVVERRVRIHSAEGIVACEITDRQIVRWKPSAGGIRVRGAAAPDQAVATQPPPLALEPAGDLEVGEIIGPFHRPGPRRVEISQWADALRDRETLFHDRDGSHALGYADLVLPGPMQSAIVDYLVSGALPDWRMIGLHMTFRQSLLAGETMEIEAIVIESEGDQRTLEVVIRNAATGETTSVGTAMLAAGNWES